MRNLKKNPIEFTEVIKYAQYAGINHIIYIEQNKYGSFIVTPVEILSVNKFFSRHFKNTDNTHTYFISNGDINNHDISNNFFELKPLKK